MNDQIYVLKSRLIIWGLSNLNYVQILIMYKNTYKNREKEVSLSLFHIWLNYGLVNVVLIFGTKL